MANIFSSTGRTEVTHILQQVLWTILIVGAFVLGAPTRAFAQDSGLSFLTLGTNAEALARGDAGVATTTGAFATYWNPAGLAGGSGHELALSHHVWIADVRTYALNAGFALGEKSGVGLFMIATGAGDLEARQQPGESDGAFDAQFVSAGASIAHRFGPLRTGMTVKFLSERIYTNAANGYGFDFGVQGALAGESVHFGATYSNLGKMQELNVEATELPKTARVGVEVFPFRMITALDGAAFLSTSLLLEVSRNFVTESTRMHVGLSGEVLETVTARVGYLSNDYLRDFSAGVGVEVVDLVFDYALLPFDDGFGGPAHILTLTYGF
ncbi:MAG: PorV/PorQ family protein [Bacteroidetes bacterium]|nr:PorV/PorQ family protein [Bacteroidota bacterium]